MHLIGVWSKNFLYLLKNGIPERTGRSARMSSPEVIRKSGGGVQKIDRMFGSRRLGAVPAYIRPGVRIAARNAFPKRALFSGHELLPAYEGAFF